MSTVHYTNCPVCYSPSIAPLLTVRDFSVSGESFVIWQCADCSLRFTQDVPDQASVGPYYQSQDYISHSDTDKGLVNRLYKKVRKYTLQRKANLVIKNTKTKGSILDLGAGTGAFLKVVGERGWEATGIEPDAGARALAKKLYGIQLLDTMELKNLPAGKFDAITLWHVLEHVHELHEYVEQLKSLLKEKGKIFIAVPNYQSLDANVYKSYWAAYDVPRHLYHFSPKSMQTLMEKHGLRIIEHKPMWFDSYYISLISTRYKNGKTGWAGAVFSGFQSNIKALFNRSACSSLIYIVTK